ARLRHPVGSSVQSRDGRLQPEPDAHLAEEPGEALAENSGPVRLGDIAQRRRAFPEVEPRSQPRRADLVARQLELQATERLEDGLSDPRPTPGRQQPRPAALLPTAP